MPIILVLTPGSLTLVLITTVSYYSSCNYLKTLL